MEIIALSKSVRIAPRKVRLVADAIRKLSVQTALDSLSNVNKRSAGPLEKTLKSAIANAKNNSKVSFESLAIKSIDILEAPSYKRYHASTKGRVHPYKRRGSHIRIILTDNKSQISNLKSQISSKEPNVQNSNDRKESK
ncbi:MAG: 50S ribosomal protein L22 [Candidatus Levybacteria bacterium CG10_big_fil_rev_8_21_14_0_10_35_13]|nr:MAG: 50S ribosomal protein L22 [Candidatus Levybacteria bacterium CG10_big_fil_rev_8_21_14_0_10_35_13]